ncbi:MAG: alanine--tRNA ligase [Candidatus Aminicenantes bacterium]|nr:MAG: alanine--tRNA ligase [Candidatus Aminicenantes bacterium]
MHAQEIRETFLDFFADKNHRTVKSASLLPKDDPTLLFTNAGMNQFKNMFLGLEKRSYLRAASVQKCMRVSGKHNDLEQVGKTNKHHTFFEMLGNFSFGDYFKKEAIEYAWELVTEGFKMAEEKLYVTVYQEDDEAFQIWNKHVGIAESRIFRYGKKDNYWAMGDTGPCGPCSEIHYDLDEEMEAGEPYDLIGKGSDRFLELWNLVFMQYEQSEQGKLLSLPSPSIDTGMGLERVATVLQGKKNNYDTDLFIPLIEMVCDLVRQEYPSDSKTDTSIRIIADHIRAVTFLIGDGIMPSNDGRGYVLRRLIRRAYRQGNFLGIENPFLYKLVGGVVDIMKDAYPELLSSANYIAKVCLSEERRFAMTLTSGLKTFDQFIEEARSSYQNVLSGDKLFKLYDTFGFPVDLSRELAEEQEMTIDEKGFQEELEKQRQRARRAWKGEALQKEKKVYEKFKDLPSEYVGYELDKTEAEVVAIIKGSKTLEQLDEGEQGEIFLDVTPFYAEAGGQVGDSGILKNPHFSGVIDSTYFPIPEIRAHKLKVISGQIRVHDKVEAVIDLPLRNALSKNHTATHLLHSSLRAILGDHVKQAGSLVSPDRLRFDFTHFAPVKPQELRQIETLVNEKIRDNIPVQTKITTMEKGIEEGAVAIFEEKYGESVRMVTVGDFSKELCGGVHVHNTGEIGLFKITSETSIAAGMRRIEALSGEAALLHVQEEESILQEIIHMMNSPKKELPEQISRLKASVKDMEKESKALRQKMANIRYQKDTQQIQTIQNISVLTQEVDGLSINELRELADSLKQKMGSGIVVLGESEGKKAFIVIAVTKDLTDRIKANDLIKKVAPMVGGGGGGRPDFAQAGGTKPEQIAVVLKSIGSILQEIIPHKITSKED